MRRRTLLRGLLFILISPNAIRAHMDTPLRYRWGRISGLPEPYSAARFDRGKFILTLGGQKYTFPEFLIALIEELGRRPRVRMHASWYHAGPAYLSIDFVRAENDGISCLFLLDDLSRIAVTRDVPLPNGYRTEAVKITKEQRDQLRAGLQTSAPQVQQNAAGQPLGRPSSFK
jgi:hypothetical protein